MGPASHLSGRRLSRRPDKRSLRAEARTHFSSSAAKLTDNSHDMPYCRKRKGDRSSKIGGQKTKIGAEEDLPRQWPCGSPVYPFPEQRTSQHHQPQKGRVGAFVAEVGTHSSSIKPPIHAKSGGLISVQEKERGSRSASCSSHTVPQCGAGQRFPGFWTRDQRGGMFWSAGVKFDPAWPEPPSLQGFFGVPGGDMRF